MFGAQFFDLRRVAQAFQLATCVTVLSRVILPSNDPGTTDSMQTPGNSFRINLMLN